MLLPLLFIGSGLWLIVQSVVGPQVEVTVKKCTSHVTGRDSSDYCTGTWTVDGHVITGDIQGATSSDKGSTVFATVNGDTATTKSLLLPLLLLGLGLPFLILPYQGFRARRRRRPTSPVDT